MCVFLDEADHDSVPCKSKTKFQNKEERNKYYNNKFERKETGKIDKHSMQDYFTQGAFNHAMWLVAASIVNVPINRPVDIDNVLGHWNNALRANPLQFFGAEEVQARKAWISASTRGMAKWTPHIRNKIHSTKAYCKMFVVKQIFEGWLSIAAPHACKSVVVGSHPSGIFVSGRVMPYRFRYYMHDH